ncbi:MAG: hypothetical protein NTW16_05640, partial [Bacteroidetes bacterium]|nr:hypothetical protein [Bacteroidota bacterium]
NLSTNSGASITGVFIKDGNAVYQNNIVSIDLDTAGLLGYGFNVAKGTNDIYFNTVSLTGENAGNDIAITMHNDPVSGNIGNNIFSNACSGSGTHRSIFIDVLNSCNIDYNDYIGKDTLTHGVSGPNCVTTPPRFPNAVGTALVDYIPQADTLAGDTLLMVTITDDIDGDARCLPTMGAQEYDTAVATPVFDLGPTSTRCVGIDTILYHATARRARTLIYSLDTASLAIGYKIDTLTGLVYYTTAYIDTTVITATATGCGGPKTATHTVTIIHSTQDFTIPASPQSYCVQNIDTATYYDPLMDITPLRPDYYTFVQGDTLLDISVANNPCCATQNTIHWRIDFMDTYNPSDSSVVHTPPVSGTGQPSEHTTDIQLPGDGVYFNDITHTITYWLVDCKGNISATKTVDIVIKPRPNVIKN